MTYEAILQKAVLDSEFRIKFLHNPLEALQAYGISITDEISNLLKDFSVDKFNKFLENLGPLSSDIFTGYM